MVRTPWILFLLVVFHAGFAVATVLTENFSSAVQKDPASTAVWNLASGAIHPTLQIKDYDADNVAPFSSSSSDVGDGSHGIFNSTTYANFGVLAGSTLTIDAAVFPALKVTSFHLENGYTLTSINGPLVIYSQSTVTIDGAILCSGINGSPAALGVGGSGGAGRCDGKSGGRGGDAMASGLTGFPTTGTVSGGSGGTYVGSAFGAGGGGAGGYAGNSGAPGDNSVAPATNIGGAGGNGAGAADHEFTILNGSPGGGGGSGSDTEGGGGGGGGGGTVIIHAVGDVIISNSGSILALGGNGGTAGNGGGGGGGSGGSVQIFTPGNLHLATGTDVDVTEGVGSIPSTANAGNGGSGSFGRTWDISSSFSGLGSESHLSALFVPGTVEYVLTPQTAISKSYDTGSSLTIFNSVTFNPVSTDVALQISGSDDNFAVDDTGWLNSSQVASLEKKRFVKFRLILTNLNSLVPTQISEVTVNYEPGTIEVFQFKSGCGLIARATPLPGNQALLIMLLLLFPLLVAQKLKTVKAKQKN